MSLLSDLALALFGWLPIGEKFIQDGPDFIGMCLRERGVDARKLPRAATLALCQLAYVRAAEQDPKAVTRWRKYVRQMEEIAEVTSRALTGQSIDDQRVRSILLLHHVI